MKVQADFIQIPQPLGKSTEEGSSSSSSITYGLKAKTQDLSNLKIIQKINDSRFPVFLAYSPNHGKNCALKLFPYLESGISPAYLNESKFSHLKHPNIISILGTIDKQRSSSGKAKFFSSCILMELAPYGDFVDIISNKKLCRDEKLARTLFQQLIEGIEYLHSQKIAHMDLKLENLLLGEDYKLKIADFDLSYMEGDRTFRGKGTRNYRPPEVRNKQCTNAYAADIYAAGVILFALKTGGFPCMEDCFFEGHDLHTMMIEQDEKFWEIHAKVHGKKAKFDKDFKELFFSMVTANPERRATISQIKNSKWYQGPVYSESELKKRLAEIGALQRIAEAPHTS